ncbi:MAG: DUF4403 family protein [Candidatus Delongbacteria bacterium]|nr:DUF4403 family protein [Candidatus Delongbacteria bacterium]MBN2835435.1 DUF4403 family protein [Candidatus Delongbacteria bacterium]
MNTKNTLILSLLFFVFSCTSTKIIPKKPEKIYYKRKLEKIISETNLNLSTSNQKLAMLLDSIIPEVIYDGKDSFLGLSAQLSKNGDIKIDSDNNFVNISIPANLKIKYFSISSPSIPLDLAFRMKIDISEDWTMNTKIFYTGIYNVLFEEIKLGFIKIRPRDTVKKIIAPFQVMLSEKINKEFNKSFDLKSQIEILWDELHKPVAIDTTYNIWLQITPLELKYYPVILRNDSIDIGLGLRSYADLTAGPKPQKLNPAPLPKLTIESNRTDEFALCIQMNLYYNDLKNIASKTILNREIENNGHKIEIVDLDFYGSKDDIVVKIGMIHDLEGIIYFTGTPVFDKKKNIFSIENIDFDLNSVSVLLRSADWLLHGTIRKTIEEELRFDLNDEIEKLKVLAQESISNLDFGNGLQMYGEIDAIKFDNFHIDSDRITLYVYARGHTGLKIR